MAEKGQTSSMTSVTEEDTSADSESDTTESSCSVITSSMLSSTDTDDKLTPGLFNISISNATNKADWTKNKQQHLGAKKIKAGHPDKVFPHEHSLLQADAKETNELNTSDNCTSNVVTIPPAFSFQYPYGSNPLPLKHAKVIRKEKEKGATLSHPTFSPSPTQVFVREKHQKCCKENLGVDDSDSKLTTDFSDTSSVQLIDNRNNNNDVESEENDTESTDTDKEKRKFLPDLSSEQWYQAKCFDRYWNHYRFVMDWYHTHIQTVRNLQANMGNSWMSPSQWIYPQQWSHLPEPWQPQRENSRRNKQSKRANHPRGTKSRTRRKRQRRSRSASLSTGEHSGTRHARNRAQSSRINQELNQNEDNDEEMEMEITDDMLVFFATSLKHKLERAKEGEQNPITYAPTERPGIRRTEEMKELYGAGAPMIQAMETAMQMTFDRFLDRFQPSLWPNMPFKINFAK